MSFNAHYHIIRNSTFFFLLLSSEYSFVPSIIQHSTPAKNTRSQRHKAVLTPTERAPFDHTPLVHQLSTKLERGLQMEGEAPSRRGGAKSRRSISFSGLLSGYPGISQEPRRRFGEAEDEEGEESVGEKESE
ncbi:hypothetical protein O181_030109 [Austropuccinia psidii MF-1]|uniref:Uncharacterized protein n=1 Tax=Austropuccinia psidii MF-1 TaxID=1389203 RepID=A0A9Q3CS77_9BASI|nr:hypothetical protein [Austropuccinia psidii MF-1]